MQLEPVSAPKGNGGIVFRGPDGRTYGGVGSFQIVGGFVILIGPARFEPTDGKAGGVSIASGDKILVSASSLVWIQ